MARTASYRVLVLYRTKFNHKRDQHIKLENVTLTLISKFMTIQNFDSIVVGIPKFSSFRIKRLLYPRQKLQTSKFK